MLCGIPFIRAIAILNGKGKSHARTNPVSSRPQAGDKSAFTVIIRLKCYQGKNFFYHAKSRSVYGDQTSGEMRHAAPFDGASFDALRSLRIYDRTSEKVEM